MTNYVPYPIRLKPVERQMLQEVPRRLDRSQADTMRVLVRGAYEFLNKKKPRPPKNQRSSQPEKENRLFVAGGATPAACEAPHVSHI